MPTHENWSVIQNKNIEAIIIWRRKLFLKGLILYWWIINYIWYTIRALSSRDCVLEGGSPKHFFIMHVLLEGLECTCILMCGQTLTAFLILISPQTGGIICLDWTSLSYAVKAYSTFLSWQPYRRGSGSVVLRAHDEGILKLQAPGPSIERKRFVRNITVTQSEVTSDV